MPIGSASCKNAFVFHFIGCLSHMQRGVRDGGFDPPME